MVEKISEVSMSVLMKGDSTPDDNALLKHIAKKKKQDEGGENISLVAMHPPGALVRLTTLLAQGGGLLKTEKQAAKEVAATSLGLAADAGQTKKGDGLRRQVALAVAGQMATPNTGKSSVIVQKGEVTPLAQGGGLQKTEKQAAKEVASASLGLAADAQQTKKGDGLRRQVALAVAGQMATPNTGKNSVIVQKGEVTIPLSIRAAASASGSEGRSITSIPVNVATNTLVDAATKRHQSATAQHSQAAAVVNPVIVTTLAPEAEAGQQKNTLRIKEDSGEARPLWQGAKQPESVVPKQGETAAQSRNSPATLQQLKTQASLASGVKGGNEGQTLEVNYQFQRWSGDHSVRISVPTDARREGNVTLLPSDVRAADVLLRNMGHLTGLSPDLLRPEQERDEQHKQRQQQQQQDEDQE